MGTVMSVALRAPERKVTAEDLYDPDEEQARLLAIFDARWTRMLRAVHALVRRAFPQWDGVLDDHATRRVLAEAAERVVRIDETTRRAIAERLQEGQMLGLSNWQLAHGSAADGFPGIDGLFKTTWKGRAETVARTELQEAQAISAQDRYVATGLVDRVRIVDGDDDPPCSSRNGRVVPVSEPVRTLHPRCTVLVIPIVREGV